MAEHQTAPATVPLDTVLLWISWTVQRDLESRAVFPALRHASAVAHRSSMALHHLEPAQAEAFLADVLARLEQVSRSLKSAYGSLLRGLRTAMEEAAQRVAVVAGNAAAKLPSRGWVERWLGTKQQLLAHGFKLSGPWPYEPGSKERGAAAKDARGLSVTITRHSPLWPDLYEAFLVVPPPDRRRDSPSKPEDVRRAEWELSTMPKSADEFRSTVVDSLRRMVSGIVMVAIEQQDRHGYALDQSVLDEVCSAFDGIAEAVSGGKVHFDPKLNAEATMRYRLMLAAADEAFTSAVAELVKPNPALLQEGLQ